MGIGRLSKDQVSAMCRSLDAGVAEPASRDLGEVGFPHLFPDATYVKRRGGRPGPVHDGRHRHRRRLRRGAPHARRRGHRHRGPRGPARARARHRRVPAGRRLAALRRAPRARRLLPAGLEAPQGNGRQGPAGRLPRDRPRHREVGALLEEAEADVLTYLDFPAEHRRRIRTNNVQERMNREIKRRSRVVQVFPSVESVLRLVGAVHAEWDEDWSSRRYISPESMRRLWEPAEPEPAESEGVAKEGPGGRRDRDGARRQRKEGRVML